MKSFHGATSGYLTPALSHPLPLQHVLCLLYFKRITGPFAFKNVYGILGIVAVFTFRSILKVSRLKILLIMAIMILTNITAVYIFSLHDSLDSGS
jgi:hypothetical protein